jgi:S-formylglutathione hydrolase FrmB
MESLGEWSWPGTSAPPEALPPSWVPASPPALALALETLAPGAWQPARSRTRRLLLGAVLSALAAAFVALGLGDSQGLERLLGRQPAAVAPAEFARASSTLTYPPVLQVPALTPISSDEAGSSVAEASFYFPALHGVGSFLVYLPPGFSTSTRRYPVLYLLPGNSQPDGAFLQVGLQGELDSLIGQHAVKPFLAVMIQGGPGSNNWRNHGSRRYETYILEVQRLVDRTLPTLATRQSRAIAGVSMGGYGAMNVTLDHPGSFATVESWLGFFNGLEGQARADRPVIAALGLHALLYGGASDHIADPSEDPAFAATLRAAGAHADGLVYPGGHSLETVEGHLGSMLTFAAHHLAYEQPPAQAPAIHLRAPH